MNIVDKNYKMTDRLVGEKEVVRITTAKPNEKETKAGHIASYILKALIREDKQIYLSYVSSATTCVPELIKKREKVLILANRMLKDDLATICGGVDKVPEKYKGKKLSVVCSLPYNKEVEITSFNKKRNSYDLLEGLEDKKVKATFVKLHLIEEV